MTLFIIPAIFVALVVLIVSGIKVDAENGGEEMIKNVYIYLVLFATLMMTIGGSVGIFMALADIIAPTPYYQTFEDFTRYGEKGSGVEGEQLSQEELRERYDTMIQDQKEQQKGRAQNSLIKSFGWIVIPFPVFIFFQRRLIKKEIQQEN